MWICASDASAQPVSPGLSEPVSRHLDTDVKQQPLHPDIPQPKPSDAAKVPPGCPPAVPRKKGDRAGERSAEIRPVKRHSFAAIWMPYYMGLAVSGLLVQLCTASQKQFFQSVADHVFSLFQQEVLPLFGTLFLSGFFLLSACFLLGFGLFGHIMVSLIVFSYGVGTGLLCLYALLLHGTRGWLFFACVPGAFAAVLSWNLGRMNSCIRQFSSYLLALAGTKENPPVRRLSGRVLVDRYLACCCIQIICCGVVAAAAGPCMKIFV